MLSSTSITIKSLSTTMNLIPYGEINGCLGVQLCILIILQQSIQLLLQYYTMYINSHGCTNINRYCFIIQIHTINLKIFNTFKVYDVIGNCMCNVYEAFTRHVKFYRGAMCKIQDNRQQCKLSKSTSKHQVRS